MRIFRYGWAIISYGILAWAAVLLILSFPAPLGAQGAGPAAGEKPATAKPQARPAKKLDASPTATLCTVKMVCPPGKGPESGLCEATLKCPPPKAKEATEKRIELVCAPFSPTGETVCKIKTVSPPPKKTK